MSIKIYKCRVVFPAKTWDDKFNPGKKKVSACFLPGGQADEKENRVNVNAKLGTLKARRLEALKRGRSVALAYIERGDKSYWDFVDLFGLAFAPGTPPVHAGREDAHNHRGAPPNDDPARRRPPPKSKQGARPAPPLEAYDQP